MIIIKREHLPASEEVLRAALAEYKAELTVFPESVNTPAPFPAFDVLLSIVADSDGDFVVYSDLPPPDPLLYDSVQNPDGTWTSTPKDPAVVEAERKARVSAEAEAELDVKLSAGFTHNGVLYHCDAVFQAQVVGFLAAFREGILPDTASVSIRTKGNVNALMSRAELLGLAGALMQHVQGIYAESWAKKDAL